MKKLLLVILCVSVISPSFAFADNKSEKRGNGNSHKSAQMAQKNEKKEEKRERKEEKKELKSLRKDNDNDNDDKRHYATTTATTTTPIQIAKKINYFLCKTDSGWNIVPLEGVKNKNNSKALGRFCMKLPYGFAKRLYNAPATTTPDIVAPVITFVTASAVTPTSAAISWNTNEATNGNVYFSTSTPVNLSTATTLGTTTLSTLHSFNLAGLTASTTYYYVVKSSDAANNTASSTQQSFVTPAVADTIVPVISSVASSGIASTTATVSWNTNELATGKLYFGTSTPLTAFVSTTTLSLAHSFNPTGLTASTTYQLLVESADSANNIATTTASLVTTN